MALSAGAELIKAILGRNVTNRLSLDRLFPPSDRESQILDKAVSSKSVDKKGSSSRLVQKVARLGSGKKLKEKKRKVFRTTPRSASLLIDSSGDRGKLG